MNIMIVGATRWNMSERDVVLGAQHKPCPVQAASLLDHVPGFISISSLRFKVNKRNGWMRVDNRI